MRRPSTVNRISVRHIFGEIRPTPMQLCTKNSFFLTAIILSASSSIFFNSSMIPSFAYPLEVRRMNQQLSHYTPTGTYKCLIPAGPPRAAAAARLCGFLRMKL